MTRLGSRRTTPFSRTNSVEAPNRWREVLRKEATDGMGIFVWPPHFVQMLEKTPWNRLDMRNKQLNMISFMLELLYDVCISRRDNVSENPGFERFLRTFQRE